VKRRDFIAFVGGAAAWPLAARAQPGGSMRRIAVLNPLAENDPEVQAQITAFRQALQKLGWTEHNLRIDCRWGEANPERLRVHAAELVALEPDVILVSSPLALQPLQQETRSIPIVFTAVSDPAGSGFVASLAHPGGNITGFAVAEFSMYGKYLELLKEVAPDVIRVAVMMNPEQAPQAGNWRAIESVAPSFKVQLTAAHVRDAAEIEGAIDAFAREPNGGLIVLPSALTIVHRGLIITLAARHRLPAVYAFRQFVVDGGLMSYGVDLVDQHRQAASYIDRILRGEKPADLPVQQPTQFRLIINLKTAKALSLEVPWFFQQRADEVIE